MWLITLSEAEAAGEIAEKQGFLLNSCQKSLVDSLLVCGTAAGWLLLLSICQSRSHFVNSMHSYLGFFALLEESLLARLLLTLLSCKVFLTRNLLNLC